MRVRVADYIAEFLIQKGITQIFSVVGGGSMHLNDAFGHNPQLTCLYNHHEQASAMAAEAYARVHSRMAVACVTSGPGAVNALTGVVGAYQDSIPMLVFSGQAKRALTLRRIGLPLRTVGGQEVDIVSAVQQNMVKFAEMVMEPEKIRYYLEKAYALALSGRPGPCWLDIPLDVQGAYVETEELMGYQAQTTVPKAAEETIQKVLQCLKEAKRPIIYAGNGIRLAGGVERFRQLVTALRVPVVTCWNSIDMIETDSPYYCGRGGNMGDRAGNFAVQNSDFLLCIGTRLSIYQVGWDVQTWAREAYTVVVDIDPYELQKPTIRVDVPVCADAKVFMEQILANKPAPSMATDWLKQCQRWKEYYPVVQKQQYEELGRCNVYAFIDTLSHRLPDHSVTVVANGSASVVGSQTYYIKEHDRFLMNCALSSMGYGLPAAIGASLASEGEPVICVEGDGSIMMNLQELQTVVTNRLPIKIFIINNNGYQQVRLSQNNLFPNGLIGMGPDSGDLGFPEFEQIAAAFGLPYKKINTNAALANGIDEVLTYPGFVLCEVLVSTSQVFEPKSATKKREDGSFVSPPLEDMAPFLSREELAKNMYIPMLPE